MKNLNKKFITKNILNLIDYSGITDAEFSNLIDVSTKQVKRIKKGDAELTLENINLAAKFFDTSISRLNSQDIEYEYLYRLKLLKKHRYQLEYFAILNKRPSISYAIQYYLIYNSKFKNEGLIISEIKELLLAIKWNYTSAYLSNAMSRNQDLVEIIGTRLVRGKEIYIYRSRQ